MSAEWIIGLVAAVLFVLLVVALTLQSIEKSNKEKRRLQAALKVRARGFNDMLEGMPAGLLNRDMRSLLCKSLISIYRQLIKIDSGDKESRGRLEQMQTMDAQLANQADSAPPTLTDSKQIREVQQQLSALMTYIGQLQKGGQLNAQQAQHHARQIRRLMLRTTIDGYQHMANEAIKTDRPRLAIHQYQMIVEKMKKENTDGSFTSAIEEYKARILALDAEALIKEQQPRIQAQENAEKWDELAKGDESWKKKAIYD